MFSKVSIVALTMFLGAAQPMRVDGQQGATPPAASPQQPESTAPPAAQQAEPAPSPALATTPEAADTTATAAWTLLIVSTGSDRVRDRSDAISALTVLEHDARAIGLVADALHDKDESVRVLAATSLGDMKARQAIPKLRDALDDASAQVSFAAAQALWKMNDRSGREILYEVLDGDRKAAPGVIQSRLKKVKSDMNDPKALALIGVNQASGAFLGPFSMGVSFLEDFASDHSAPVQAICARLLATDDTQISVDELSNALGDKSWVVRASAARALARMHHPHVMPQLRDMLAKDKSRPARFAAAPAIIQLSPPVRTLRLPKPAIEKVNSSAVPAS